MTRLCGETNRNEKKKKEYEEKYNTGEHRRGKKVE